MGRKYIQTYDDDYTFRLFDEDTNLPLTENVPMEDLIQSFVYGGIYPYTVNGTQGTIECTDFGYINFTEQRGIIRSEYTIKIAYDNFVEFLRHICNLLYGTRNPTFLNIPTERLTLNH